MEGKNPIKLAFEKLRMSMGVFPFHDYGLCFFNLEELNKMTNHFSEDNLIGAFQFGKVYRGFTGKQYVTVKKWEHPEFEPYYMGENEIRQRNEVVFLKQKEVSSHPNLVKLIGYCCEGEDHLFMVYDMKPLNSLYNLVLEDSFCWLRRIKVLLGFAKLLRFLHAAGSPNSPYLVRNIEAAHILVDEDYNPILYDFGMITGGIFPHWKEYPNQLLSAAAGYSSISHDPGGRWGEEEDVFAFGTILLMLISKRVYSEHEGFSKPYVFQWASDDHRSKKSAVGFDKLSLVHVTLLGDDGYYAEDGVKITKIGINCVRGRFLRPTMKQVVKKLLELQVVQDHPNILGLIDPPHCRAASKSTPLSSVVSDKCIHEYPPYK